MQFSVLEQRQGSSTHASRTSRWIQACILVPSDDRSSHGCRTVIPRCEYRSANAGGSTHPWAMLEVPREIGYLPLRFDHIRSISESVRPHRVVRIASSGPKSGWSRGVDPRMGPADRRLGGGRRSCRFARRASWLMPLRAHTRGSPSPPSIARARQAARPTRRANPRAKRPAYRRERVYESATLRRAPNKQTNKQRRA